MFMPHQSALQHTSCGLPLGTPCLDPAEKKIGLDGARGSLLVSCPAKGWPWVIEARIGASETSGLASAFDVFKVKTVKHVKPSTTSRFCEQFEAQAHGRRMASCVHLHVGNDASFDFQRDLMKSVRNFETMTF